VTVPDLIRRCARCGFAVVYDPDAGPAVRPVRPGARLPADLLAALKQNRGEIVVWFRSGGKPAGSPAECNGVRCSLCEPLTWVPADWGHPVLKTFLGCHYKDRK
jgi:hypothetical protein